MPRLKEWAIVILNIIELKQQQQTQPAPTDGRTGPASTSTQECIKGKSLDYFVIKDAHFDLMISDAFS